MASRELVNFTYELQPLNKQAAVQLVALTAGVTWEQVATYLKELEADQGLRQHVQQHIRASRERWIADEEFKPAKRLLFYLLVRALKPRAVVEAGVDKGFGSCLIAAALERNAREGHTGYLWGIDITPGKGYLFAPPYDARGKIVYEDSVEFLRRFPGRIDLFFHETVNEIQHEHAQFAALETLLSKYAVVYSAWYTEGFLEFARRTQRHCLIFAERPVRHWYPGAHSPLAFRLRPTL